MFKYKFAITLCASLLLNVGVVKSAVLRYDSPVKEKEVDNRLPFVKYGIEKPERPNGSIDSRTIAGIDTNYNGVRDSAEIEIYDLLEYVEEMNKGDYEDTLRVASLITPIEPLKTRSMYPEVITCEYSKLPYYIRSRISEVDLYDIVLNNSKRKIAFRESLVPIEERSIHFSC